MSMPLLSFSTVDVSPMFTWDSPGQVPAGWAKCVHHCDSHQIGHLLGTCSTFVSNLSNWHGACALLTLRNHHECPKHHSAHHSTGSLTELPWHLRWSFKHLPETLHVKSTEINLSTDASAVQKYLNANIFKSNKTWQISNSRWCMCEHVHYNLVHINPE